MALVPLLPLSLHNVGFEGSHLQPKLPFLPRRHGYHFLLLSLCVIKKLAIIPSKYYKNHEKGE